MRGTGAATAWALRAATAWALRAATAWAICASVLCVTTSVCAETEDGSNAGATEDATNAFWTGKHYYDRGQFDRALTHFQKAYDLTQNPELLYNLAQTHRRLGDCTRAREAYRDFLRTLPPAPLAARTEQQLAQLESSCPSFAAGATAPATQSGAETPPSGSPPSGSPPSGTQPLASTQEALSPLKVSISREPVRERPSQQARPGRTWRLSSVVALTAGLAAGGAAAGLAIWNEGQYQKWRRRDQNLARGPAPGEASTSWLVRQDQNDRLSRSIDKVDRATLLLGASGIALVGASVVLYCMPPPLGSRGGVSKPPRLRASGFLSPSNRLEPGGPGGPPTGLFITGSF